MLRQKLSNFLAAMNGSLVPHEDDGAVHSSQQLFQEIDNLVTRQVAFIRLRAQADDAFARCDQQRGNRIDSLIVLNARPNFGSLTSRRPRALEGTDQRLPIFIDKNQGCIQVMPLFLSAAKYSVSSAQLQPRHAEKRPAVVFDNSSPCVARDTTPRWNCIGYQTDAQSPAQCARGSNSLRRSRKQRPRATKSAPVVSTVAVLSDRDDAVAVQAFAGGAAAACPAASVARCGESRLQHLRPGLRCNLVAAVLVRALGARPVVRVFQEVSCFI